MVKYNPTTVSTGLNSAAAINANLQTIADLLNSNVLFRDLSGPLAGEPNTVNETLDMNSNRIINLVDGVNPGDAATVRQVEDKLSGTRASETVDIVSVTAVVTLASITYTVGGESILVYINGIYQKAANYTETSSTVITISENLGPGDEVTVLALFE